MHLVMHGISVVVFLGCKLILQTRIRGDMVQIFIAYSFPF